MRFIVFIVFAKLLDAETSKNNKPVNIRKKWFSDLLWVVIMLTLGLSFSVRDLRLKGTKKLAVIDVLLNLKNGYFIFR